MLMKRTFTFIMLLLLTTTMATQRVSAQVQSPDRDKISEVMLNMIDQWDHQSFLNAVGLVTQVTQYDMTGLTAEVLQRVAGMKTAIEGTPDYRLLFSSKAITGHYIVRNGKWVKESDAYDLQLSYTSPDGVPCVLRMTMSGKVAVTNIPIEEDDYYDDYDDEYYDDDEYYGEDEFFSYISKGINELNSITDMMNGMMKPLLEDVKMLSAEIPEKTTIEVTYGGSPIMTSDIQIDPNSVGETLYDGMLITLNTKFYKGALTRGGAEYFEVAMNNTGYMPGTGLNLDFSIKHNDLQLLSVKVNAPGTLMPLDLGALLSGQPLDLGFESLNVDVNFMGQMQLKGGIEDMSALFAAMASVDEEDEESLQAAMAQVNQMINMFVYYDGSNTPAAKIQVLPGYDEEWMEWTLKPAILFARDNSAYTLEEYLSAENFPEVAEGMVNIVSEIFGLVNVIYEKTGDEVTGFSVKPQENATATAYYTLDGRRTTATARGVKIVSMSDGTVRKVVTR